LARGTGQAGEYSQRDIDRFTQILNTSPGPGFCRTGNASRISGPCHRQHIDRTRNSWQRRARLATIKLVGTGLTTVALALLADDLAAGQAGIVLGTALAIKMVAYLGIAPLVGPYAAQLPRRWLLVGLDLLRAALRHRGVADLCADLLASRRFSKRRSPTFWIDEKRTIFIDVDSLAGHDPHRAPAQALLPARGPAGAIRRPVLAVPRLLAGHLSAGGLDGSVSGIGGYFRPAGSGSAGGNGSRGPYLATP